MLLRPCGACLRRGKACVPALTARAFECVTDDGRRIKAGRHFRLYVGGSQPDAVSAALTGKEPIEIDLKL